MEWAPNALVLTNAGRGKAGRVSVGARFFGFSNAYKTDPAPEEHHAGPSTFVNVQNTTINETNINETNINETNIRETNVHNDIHQTNVHNDVRVNQTDIVEQQQSVHIEH